MKNTFHTLAATGFFLAAALSAHAHVVMDPAPGAAGARFDAVLRVGHGCDGAATTGLTVRIPPGFSGALPTPRAGWTTAVKRGKLGAKDDVVEVSWTASSPQAAVPNDKPGEFTLSGKLPDAPGPLWFAIAQACGGEVRNWAQLPAQGTTSTQGMKFPAALLNVVSAQDLLAMQAVRVEGAWVRATAPGQSGTAAFMKLTASEGMRLVGVATPAAGVAQVHEMKMDGGVMKMRPVDVLELPAGKTVELTPGGYHVMLMDLKAPLAKDASVPITLVLKNAKGVESRLEVKALVGMAAPGADGGMAGMDHSQHMK